MNEVWIFEKQQAIAEMIDGAIRSLGREEFACAITLAAAAEGAIPQDANKQKMFFHETKRQFMVEFGWSEKEAVAMLNQERDWLKHHNDGQPELIELGRRAAGYLVRSIVQYERTYGVTQLTDTMRSYVHKEAAAARKAGLV